MPIESKELSLLAGVAAGSLAVGGLVGYLLTGRNKNEDGEKLFSKKSYEFKDPITEYVIANSSREPQVLKELHEHTLKNVDMGVMLSDPIQCQFFRLLLHTLDAKKCLEVGVFTGYNVLNCALCMPTGGKVYGLDVNERWVNHGRPFFKKAGVEDKVEIRIAPAADSMDQLISEGHSGSFDFIYVDADKPGYDIYYEKGLTLLRKGGIIAFDNMLQKGYVAALDKPMEPCQREDAVALDKLNKKLHHDQRVQISFLAIADGVYFARKL